MLEALRGGVSKGLRVPAANWLNARDPTDRTRRVAVLPLDHDGRRWKSERWPLPGRRKTLELIAAEGPAGLRLPLNLLPEKAMRRALTLEAHADGLHLFLPPLLQATLPGTVDAADPTARRAGGGAVFLRGLPADATK